MRLESDQITPRSALCEDQKRPTHRLDLIAHAQRMRTRFHYLSYDFEHKPNIEVVLDGICLRRLSNEQGANGRLLRES